MGTKLMRKTFGLDPSLWWKPTLFRFAVVGLINTAIGLAVIFAALNVGFDDYPANALGYGFGLVSSYLLNRSWTFKVENAASAGELMRFITAFLLSYAANLLVIALFRAGGHVAQPMVHLVAMALYSLCFYTLSRWFVFRGEGPGFLVEAAAAGRRYWPELLLLGASIVLLAALWAIPLTHDVVWQLWIARQLLDGATLYSDIWEVNPPLWFWSAMPVVYLGGLLGLDPSRLLIALVWMLGVLSVVLLGKLTAMSAPKRAIMMLCSLWVMLVAPIYDFGQREQLVLIFALPYAALIARRGAGLPVTPALAIIVGLMASYGFALKHYFVLVPIFLELWLIVRMRRDWRPIRLETALLAISAIVYGLCVLLFARGFLDVMLPMIGAAYQGYDSSWEMMLERPWIYFWLASIVFLLVYGRGEKRRADPVVATFLITALAFGLSYFLQKKGWLYHSVPMTGALAMAVVVRLGMPDLRRITPLVSGLAILAYIAYVPWLTGPYRNFFQDESEPILARVAAGHAVLVISGDPMWAWPMIEKYRLVWPSRLYAYWMIPAIAHAEVLGPYPEELRKLARLAKDEAYLEMRCAGPDLVMFERKRNYIFQPSSFNVRDFFLQDRRIKEFLSHHYREIPSDKAPYAYQRTGPVPMIDDLACPLQARGG